MPVVFAGNDTAYCAGDSVTLSGSGASTYTWNNGVANGVPFVPTIPDVSTTIVNMILKQAQTVGQIQILTLLVFGKEHLPWDNLKRKFWLCFSNNRITIMDYYDRAHVTSSALDLSGYKDLEFSIRVDIIHTILMIPVPSFILLTILLGPFWVLILRFTTVHQ